MASAPALEAYPVTSTSGRGGIATRNVGLKLISPCRDWAYRKVSETRNALPFSTLKENIIFCGVSGTRSATAPPSVASVALLMRTRKPLYFPEGSCTAAISLCLVISVLLNSFIERGTETSVPSSLSAANDDKENRSRSASREKGWR